MHLFDVADPRVREVYGIVALFLLAAGLFVAGVALLVRIARGRRRRSYTIAAGHNLGVQILDRLVLNGRDRVEVIAVDQVHGTLTVRPYVARGTRFRGIYAYVRGRLRRNHWGAKTRRERGSETSGDRA